MSWGWKLKSGCFYFLMLLLILDLRYQESSILLLLLMILTVTNKLFNARMDENFKVRFKFVLPNKLCVFDCFLIILYWSLGWWPQHDQFVASLWTGRRRGMGILFHALHMDHNTVWSVHSLLATSAALAGHIWVHNYCREIRLQFQWWTSSFTNSDVALTLQICQTTKSRFYPIIYCLLQLSVMVCTFPLGFKEDFSFNGRRNFQLSSEQHQGEQSKPTRVSMSSIC